jgi:hypothetical protein
LLVSDENMTTSFEECYAIDKFYGTVKWLDKWHVYMRMRKSISPSTNFELNFHLFYSIESGE